MYKHSLRQEYGATKVDIDVHLGSGERYVKCRYTPALTTSRQHSWGSHSMSQVGGIVTQEAVHEMKGAGRLIILLQSPTGRYQIKITYIS